MSFTDRESAAETNTIEQELDGANVVSCAVAQFEQKLLRYAQLWVGQLDSARDVVQETFLQLHRQVRTQMPPTLAAWLFTVCRHRAIDWCRRERRANSKSTLKDTDMGVAQATAETDGPIESLIRDESHRELRDQLEGLTATQRETLRLRFQSGLSYQEISQVTGMTVNHVGVTIHAALQKLRERMGTNPQN
ncbi:MAG: sigma-70 family RNA polymerase sigma factor [Pirellulaceae bacterium]|nr:sigma-70 family RNA polymerase sigma factor [Pirellulaceae bacterium]